MCLTIKLNAIKHTAKNDIVVYKHVLGTKNDEYFTTYQKANIKIGGVYQSKLKSYISIFGSDRKVEIGLHSFADLSDCRQDAIDELYYLLGSNKYVKILVVKCVIPKGSKYYSGDYVGASYASTSLKYVEIIETYFPTA